MIKDDGFLAYVHELLGPLGQVAVVAHKVAFRRRDIVVEQRDRRLRDDGPVAENAQAALAGDRIGRGRGLRAGSRGEVPQEWHRRTECGECRDAGMAEETKPRFLAAGCAPFAIVHKGQPMEMSYWSVPDEAMDTSEDMAPWAKLAIAAALRKPVVKKAAKSSKKKKPAL